MIKNIGLCNYCNHLYDCDNNYNEEKIKKCINQKINILLQNKEVIQ